MAAGATVTGSIHGYLVKQSLRWVATQPWRPFLLWPTAYPFLKCGFAKHNKGLVFVENTMWLRFCRCCADYQPYDSERRPVTYSNLRKEAKPGLVLLF
jgi:hypothetical protein